MTAMGIPANAKQLAALVKEGEGQALEGMAFLERTMPLGARFPEGKIFREDPFPVPLGALREILLNQSPAGRRGHGGSVGGPVDSAFGCVVAERPLRPCIGGSPWDAQQDRRIETDARRDGG